MLAPLKWINEYTELSFTNDDQIQELCDRLDLTGTGVEGVNKMGASFDKIVTGKVISKEKHPDSDHMWVCQVDVGEKNVDESGNPCPLQIVCGAQNFNEGDHIVVSMVGAILPGDIKIKKAKLRGIVSNGMNCSERELGLGDNHDGIMILPNDAPVGMDFADYYGSNDVVLDLEITPNRPDCLSIRGLAREFAAINDKPWTDPLDKDLDDLDLNLSDENVNDEVLVSVVSPTRCPRYTACVVKGVKVGPSPKWLVDKLASMGQRSVNNIVDVTNYILFLYGQPLHSFDLDWLKNGQDQAHIVVRGAREGETLTTLDGQARELSEDMTLITTESAGPVGLAGVMGGLNSEITDSTTNVCIETATFDPGRTSRTSRNLNLFSESSMRYEREVDDHDIEKRARIAAALVQSVAGGEILSDGNGNFGLVDVWEGKKETNRLQFRVDRFNKFVGENIEKGFVTKVLNNLGCKVDEGGETLTVVPPTFRPDLEREVDLYEEVLRIYGEDRIPSTLPRSEKRVGKLLQEDKIRRVIDRTLRACGLDETLSYSFTSEAENEMFRPKDNEDSLSVEIINPLNAEESKLRQSIIPGLLKSVEFNFNHGEKTISLYEIGKVFTTTNARPLPKERDRISGVLSGLSKVKTWDEEERKFDFFDGKGCVEKICDALNFQKVRFKADDNGQYPFLQPGRAAQVHSGGTLIGWVGEIHPQVLAEFGIEDVVVAFEIDMHACLTCAKDSKQFIELSEFPAIEVDQNFVVDEVVTCEKMQQVITSAGGKLLRKAVLVDIYRNPISVGVGKKSMSFKLTYQALDRTLESSEVEKLHNKVVTKVAGATGATKRGK